MLYNIVVRNEEQQMKRKILEFIQKKLAMLNE
jgi:hypothetical protein